MDSSPTCTTAHRQWSLGALSSYPVIKSSIDSKQVTDLSGFFLFFFLTTCNFAVVCTFSPRHIGYHLLFITKNVLTTKSHIPDTQKREDIATIFWARGSCSMGNSMHHSPGMQSSPNVEHLHLSLHNRWVWGFQNSCPLFIHIAAYWYIIFNYLKIIRSGYPRVARCKHVWRFMQLAATFISVFIPIKAVRQDCSGATLARLIHHTNTQQQQQPHPTQCQS